MGGVRLVTGVMEAESHVEPGSLLGSRPEPHTREVDAGVIDQGVDDRPPDPNSPLLRMHVEMAKTGHGGVVEKRISVQPSDPGEMTVHPNLDCDLTRPGELVGTVDPVVDKPLHQIVAFVETCLEESVDVGRERIQRMNRHFPCDHDGNGMRTLRRVVVVGSSGSGKTTFARALAERMNVSHLEMDSVFHRHGLADEAHDEFLPTLDRFTDQERWVVDGNYTSHGTRDVVWPKADTVVWLDPPRRLAMARVIRRTLRRTVLREELWPGVHEPLSNLYSLDPYKNIIVWTWTRHAHVRRKYEAAMTGDEWNHARVLRFRSTSDARNFLDSLD